MIFIPEYIEKLEPYKPGKSSDMDSYGGYKAIICSNENNLGPSPLAMKAIQNSVDQLHLYPDPQGEKLIKKLSLKHDRPFEEFVLSNGLDGLLYTLFKAFTVAGDHVISSEFSFVAFNKFAKMNNTELELAPMTEDFKFDLDEILKRVKPKTRIVYLCNPNNPTGTAVMEAELKAFLNKVPENVLVVVDEAYFEFARDHDGLFPDTISMNYPNVLSLRTLSKIYGLAGLRVGYGVASERIISALKKVKLVFNPNVLAQVGAIAALGDEAHLEKTLANNNKWHRKLRDILLMKSYKVLTSYANFITLVFSSMDEAHDFDRNLKEQGILVRKLDGFDLPQAVRISIGNDLEMQHVVEVLTHISN